MRHIYLIPALALFAGSAAAEEIGFGPIEIGVTSCESAHAALTEAGALAKEGTSAVTGGMLLSLKRLAFGFDFVSEGSVICDADNSVVEAVLLTIPKHRSRDIADALQKKYETVRVNFPQLGTGEAMFLSKTKQTIAEIYYQHVSFNADVSIYTTDFERTYEGYRKRKAEAEEDKLDSAF